MWLFKRRKEDAIDFDLASWKEQIPKYVPQITHGKVVDVYDGDSLTIVGKVAHNPDLFRFSVRIAGIDCPEIRTQNANEKCIAEKARKFTQGLTLHKTVHLRNVDLDKYGRLLAQVMVANADNSTTTTMVNVADALLENRLAVRYNGKTKQVPTDWRAFHMGDWVI